MSENLVKYEKILEEKNCLSLKDLALDGKDLISLGKFLLLPTDDLSLAEVLKSPLFGLDDDDFKKGE